MSNSLPPEKKHPARVMTASSVWLVRGLMIATLLVIVVLMTVAVLNRRGFPAVTRERFDAAQKRWKDHGLENYDMEIRVSSRQSATYAVVVRGGIVKSASRNGEPLKQARTFETWSVPGMFGTMSHDVSALERMTTGEADQQVPRLSLRARFHPQFGYPERFLRLEQTGGTNPEVYWEVTKFEERSDATQKSDSQR